MAAAVIYMLVNLGDGANEAMSDPVNPEIFSPNGGASPGSPCSAPVMCGKSIMLPPTPPGRAHAWSPEVVRLGETSPASDNIADRDYFASNHSTMKVGS